MKKIIAIILAAFAVASCDVEDLPLRYSDPDYADVELNDLLGPTKSDKAQVVMRMIVSPDFINIPDLRLMEFDYYAAAFEYGYYPDGEGFYDMGLVEINGDTLDKIPWDEDAYYWSRDFEAIASGATYGGFEATYRIFESRIPFAENFDTTLYVPKEIIFETVGDTIETLAGYRIRWNADENYSGRCALVFIYLGEQSNAIDESLDPHDLTWHSYIEDDGEFELPEEVVKNFPPEGFFYVQVGRESRFVANMSSSDVFPQNLYCGAIVKAGKSVIVDHSGGD